MKLDGNDPAVILKEFHKLLCREMGWRCIKHTWHTHAGTYIQGIRDRDGAAELLECLKGKPSRVVHTGVLTDTQCQAQIQDIIKNTTTWVDPPEWKVYDVTFTHNNCWVYWLHNSDARPKSKPYQVVVRCNEVLDFTVFTSKKAAGKHYRKVIREWKDNAGLEEETEEM